MRGSKMTGAARDFVDQMLPVYVGEKELSKVGIYREDVTRQWRRSEPVNVEVHFVRPHREVDITSYGDAHPVTLVVSPGLDATVTGEEREINLFALTLIHQGVLTQLESEQQAGVAQGKRLSKSEAAKQERERALLVMYGKLGKKRRANLAASDPTVAALCVRLEEERAESARIDAMEYS